MGESLIYIVLVAEVRSRAIGPEDVCSALSLFLGVRALLKVSSSAVDARPYGRAIPPGWQLAEPTTTCHWR